MAEARDRRGRGSALLRAPRRRRARHPARRLGGRHEPRRRPGRLDDHAAVRQERDQPGRANDLAQAAGGSARLAARAAPVEGLDPDRVPEHGLLRERRLRRRAGLPHLLRPQRRHRARDPRRGGAARGDPRRPEPLRPGRPPDGRRARGRNLVLRLMLQQHYLEPRAVPGRRSRRRCPSRRRCACRRLRATPAPYFANYVTDQLVRQFHTRGVYGGGLRVRTTIDLKLQKFARDAIANGAPARDRPDRGARQHRCEHRCRARDGRRPQLPPQPVQPRDAGRAPARLRVQAVRARRGAQGRDLAVDDARLAPGDDRHRRARSGRRPTTRASYSGTIDLRQAIAYSDNSVFAQLTNIVGPANVAADREDARHRDAA